MKFVPKAVQTFAVLAAVSGSVILTGCASLEDNMAASRKEHLVPGKQLHVVNEGDNLVFCEVALITGTSKANAIADFYNSTGTDVCTPEKFAGLDKAQILKETGAREVFLTRRRSSRRPEPGKSSSIRRGVGCSMCSMSFRTASSGPSAASR
jgi:hypothetical protein